MDIDETICRQLAESGRRKQETQAVLDVRAQYRKPEIEAKAYAIMRTGVKFKEQFSVWALDFHPTVCMKELL